MGWWQTISYDRGFEHGQDVGNHRLEIQIKELNKRINKLNKQLNEKDQEVENERKSKLRALKEYEASLESIKRKNKDRVETLRKTIKQSKALVRS
jgi:TolA-binding protein